MGLIHLPLISVDEATGYLAKWLDDHRADRARSIGRYTTIDDTRALVQVIRACTVEQVLIPVGLGESVYRTTNLSHANWLVVDVAELTIVRVDPLGRDGAGEKAAAMYMDHLVERLGRGWVWDHYTDHDFQGPFDSCRLVSLVLVLDHLSGSRRRVHPIPEAEQQRWNTKVRRGARKISSRSTRSRQNHIVYTTVAATDAAAVTSTKGAAVQPGATREMPHARRSLARIGQYYRHGKRVVVRRR